MKPAMVMAAMCLALLAGCAVGPNYHPAKCQHAVKLGIASGGWRNKRPRQSGRVVEEFQRHQSGFAHDDGRPIQPYASRCRSPRA